MKKALFFVGLSLLLPMASMRPADAAHQLTAKNETPYTVKGSITYMGFLCRNDHPTIAPGTTFRVSVGGCHAQKVNFSADGHACELIGGRPFGPTTFVIRTGSELGYRTLYCGFTARR